MIENRYLFKAKRVDNGEWIEGSYVYTFTPDKECPVVGVHKENHWIVEKNGNIVIVDPSTICQCTGLMDKNGKLIWENDIVSHTYTKHEDFTEYPPLDYIKNSKNYVIKWDSTMVYCGFRYHNGRNIFPFKKGTVINGKDEVVGNIFDNPKLLE